MDERIKMQATFLETPSKDGGGLPGPIDKAIFLQAHEAAPKLEVLSPDAEQSMRVAMDDIAQIVSKTKYAPMDSNTFKSQLGVPFFKSIGFPDANQFTVLDGNPRRGSSTSDRVVHQIQITTGSFRYGLWVAIIDGTLAYGIQSETMRSST